MPHGGALQIGYRPAGGFRHSHKLIDEYRVTENNEEHETLKDNKLELMRIIQYMKVMGIRKNYMTLSHYLNIIY